MSSTLQRKTIGPVQILHLIGGGGMGEVYQGFHTRLQIPCTVKVIKPELTTDHGLVKRFLQEARLAASLRHHNIVRIYDVDLADGVPFFVMELLEGESLDAILQRQHSVEPARAVAVGLQMAGALAHAHQRGIIHRDVKPDNVVVDPQWHSVLTDFGLAALRHARMRLTEPGTPVGTPDYASPEQLSGRAGVDGRSDLYSLGVVLYELLCGELPFPDQRSLEGVLARLDSKPPPLRTRMPSLPEPLDELIMRLLEPRPEDRPSSGDEVESELRRMQSLPGLADPKTSEARVISAAAAGGQSLPTDWDHAEPPPPFLLLPRTEGGILVTGASLAEHDLLELLRSFARSTRHQAGYMLVSYAKSGDLVLYQGGKPVGCFRFVGQSWTEISGTEVFQRAGELKNGRVGAYLVPDELLLALQTSLTEEPVFKNLRGTFIRFDKLLEEISSMMLDGFIRLRTGQAQSFLLYQRGEASTAYLAGELLTSCQGDPQTEVARLIERAAVPVVIDVFAFPKARTTDPPLPIRTPSKTGAGS